MERLTESEIGSGVLASLGVVLGSVLTKLVTGMNKINQLNFEDSRVHRSELKKRCEQLEAENAKLQQKYFVDLTIIKEQNINLKAEIAALRVQVKTLKSQSKLDESELEKFI